MLVSITPVLSSTILNLTGTVNLSALTLKWDLPISADFYRTRVYYNSVNNFSTATVSGDTGANTAVLGLSAATSYFWVRAVNIYGRADGPVTGPYTAVAGSVASTSVSGLGTLATKSTIAQADFSAGIAPIAVVSALPSPTGYTGPALLLLSSDNKVYRYVASTPAFVASVPATDLTGILSAFQIGSIPTTQLSGTITTGQISANSIGAGQIAANSIGAGQIAANSITATQISSSYVYAGTISANNITAGTLTGVALNAGTGQYGGYAFKVTSTGATYISYLYTGNYICDNASSTSSSAINAQSVSSADTITVSNNYSGNALNVTVGKTNLAGTLAIGGQTTSKAITPSTDNASVCGYTGQAWNNVFSYIYTTVSDRRAKTDIADIAYGLNFIKSLRPVSYKMAVGLNTEVEVAPAVYDSKGVELSKRVVRVDSKPGVRTHFGLIAQEVKTAVGGLDSALWVLADKNDPNSDQALRYDGFIAPLIKAVQELSDRLDKLEKGRPA